MICQKRNNTTNNVRGYSKRRRKSALSIRIAPLSVAAVNAIPNISLEISETTAV